MMGEGEQKGRREGKMGRKEKGLYIIRKLAKRIHSACTGPSNGSKTATTKTKAHKSRGCCHFPIRASTGNLSS
jgi:hypothetical protein